MRLASLLSLVGFLLPITRTVCSSGCDYSNLQTALNAGQCGDTLSLRAGQTFSGHFTAPAKSCTSDILVTSDASLPPGLRVDPSLAPLLAKLSPTTNGAPTLTVAISATHWIFRGLEILPPLQAFYPNVMIGAGDSTQFSELQEPDSITIDQCWIHGDRLFGARAGIEDEGKHTVISNNWISEIKNDELTNNDVQAIFGYNARGPVSIYNNHLEASTENLIYGGGDPLNHVYMTATGGATTTSATVATSEGHLLSDVKEGQRISILTTSGTKLEHSIVRSVTGAGTTGTVTFDALSAVVTVPGGLRTGAVKANGDIHHNHFTKNLDWRQPILPPVGNPSAVGSTASGTLGAGTYCYKIQSKNPNGYKTDPYQSDLSAEKCASLGSNGHVDVAGNVTPDAVTYRFWRGSTGAENLWTDSASPAISDNGSVTWTSAATPTDSNGSNCASSGVCGTHWKVKNLIELKAATDFHVWANIFEYSWSGYDVGYFAWLKSVNQDGACWFCEGARYLVEYNLVRHVPDGILFSGAECAGGCTATTRPHLLTDVTIRQNLFYDVNHQQWEYYRLAAGNQGAMFTISNGPDGLIVDHNTFDKTDDGVSGGLIYTDSTSLKGTRWTFSNNLMRAGTYGIHDPVGNCKDALDLVAPGYAWVNNAIADYTVGTPCPPSPPNFYAPSATYNGYFTNYRIQGDPADYKLKASSPYHNAATDGTDLGADIRAVLLATAGVVNGNPRRTTLGVAQ